MDKIGLIIRVSGIVQGVGFRPFIHKQITDHSLCGWIRNTSAGAEMRLEGEETALRRFVDELLTKKPALALIEKIETEVYEPLEGFTDFHIIASKSGEERDTLISPDVCTCDDCIRELFDPEDRRYRYPFINCTNCGPRFTIIRDIPYDRDKTTMAPFKMCAPCRAEYTDINDRRYHAQPDCCPDCGPQLILTDASGNRIEGDPIRLAEKMLMEGGIVAVKGLGGFHLACRADIPALSLKLRKRKHRDEKPFALMCADVAEAKRYCRVSKEEEALLSSKQRPIVLLKKRTESSSESAAKTPADQRDAYLHLSENGRIGVMLPYTPLHFLLLHDELKSLVMTSANLSDRPIIYRNEEALECLRGIADGFLMHDREIHVRCDDSVLWEFQGKPYFARRSRGYVPYPITAKTSGTGLKILALGAEQKATFSLSKGNHVFSSQHIGDLKNIETFENFESQIKHFEKLFEIKPEAFVCDLHPDYLSTAYAIERAEREGAPLIRVQHHFAHMASCMADNSLDEPVIGIIWDGTGLGTDGTSWGGEFLTGDFGGFRRYGSIRPMRLPGGDKATHEIWRIAAALMKELGTDRTLPGVSLQQLELIFRQLEAGINSPVTTSIGRLFDGVSAIIGIRETVSYEGQGAILLEAAALPGCEESYPYIIEENDLKDENAFDQPKYRFDWRPMLREILRELSEAALPAIVQADPGSSDDTPVTDTGSSAGLTLSALQQRAAAKFMNTLVRMAAEMAGRISKDTGIGKVVLSGGSFQNMYILERLVRRLREEGLEPFTHSRVSCNDEGLSLGQLMIAGRQAE
ncbi:MAG: carbamoyltransferase HypF [Lachnospiraceae bacterium]|nr:carbamoyltransferase HypF [Lachnospiraceae bacterium]